MHNAGRKGMSFEPPSIMATYTIQFLQRRDLFISLQNTPRHAEFVYELFTIRAK